MSYTETSAIDRLKSNGAIVIPAGKDSQGYIRLTRPVSKSTAAAMDYLANYRRYYVSTR